MAGSLGLGLALAVVGSALIVLRKLALDLSRDDVWAIIKECRHRVLIGHPNGSQLLVSKECAEENPELIQRWMDHKPQRRLFEARDGEEIEIYAEHHADRVAARRDIIH